MDRRLPLRRLRPGPRLAAVHQPDDLVEPHGRDSSTAPGGSAVVVGTSWNTHYASSPATRQVLAVYADNGRNVPGWPVTTNGPTFGSPAIGRIDGQTAVVSTSCAHCPNGPAMVSAWSGSGRLIWSRAYGGDHEADASPVLVDLTGGRDDGDDVLVGDARGLSLIAGKNGDFLYNTGAPRSAVQRGCDVASNPAVAYIPGAPGNGWMMYLACGGPHGAGEAGRLPVADGSGRRQPAGVARMEGERRPHRSRRTRSRCRERRCAHSVVRGKGYRLITGEGAMLRFRQPLLLRRHERDRHAFAGGLDGLHAGRARLLAPPRGRLGVRLRRREVVRGPPW